MTKKEVLFYKHSLSRLNRLFQTGVYSDLINSGTNNIPALDSHSGVLYTPGEYLFTRDDGLHALCGQVLVIRTRFQTLHVT